METQKTFSFPVSRLGLGAVVTLYMADKVIRGEYKDVLALTVEGFIGYSLAGIVGSIADDLFGYATMIRKRIG